MTDFDSDSASSQLRVIRSLMERATIYRSLSAPTALVGGLLSFGGLGLAYLAENTRGEPLSEGEFLAVWLTILALTCLTNAVVLWRESQRQGMPFFSPGMKCALRSVLPPFLSGAVLSLACQSPLLQAFTWTLFYGLGLLAMQHFAPRSILVLGWVFLLATGVGFFTVSRLGDIADDYEALVASCVMASTFGLFHVLYAAAVWAMSGNAKQAPAVTDEAEHV